MMLNAKVKVVNKFENFVESWHVVKYLTYEDTNYIKPFVIYLDYIKPYVIDLDSVLDNSSDFFSCLTPNESCTFWTHWIVLLHLVFKSNLKKIFLKGRHMIQNT